MMRKGWWLTDSKRADKDTKNICITSFLNDRVPPHQELICFCRLKGGLPRHGVISMDLEATEKNAV
jgi:hypothetical protein